MPTRPLTSSSSGRGLYHCLDFRDIVNYLGCSGRGAVLELSCSAVAAPVVSSHCVGTSCESP